MMFRQIESNLAWDIIWELKIYEILLYRNELIVLELLSYFIQHQRPAQSKYYHLQDIIHDNHPPGRKFREMSHTPLPARNSLLPLNSQ